MKHVLVKECVSETCISETCVSETYVSQSEIICDEEGEGKSPSPFRSIYIKSKENQIFYNFISLEHACKTDLLSIIKQYLEKLFK